MHRRNRKSGAECWIRHWAHWEAWLQWLLWNWSSEDLAAKLGSADELWAARREDHLLLRTRSEKWVRQRLLAADEDLLLLLQLLAVCRAPAKAALSSGASCIGSTCGGGA